MTKVVDLKTPFFGEVPPHKVLEGAEKERLDTVIVIGYRGDSFYFASSTGDCPKVLWALEEAKKELME